MDNASEPGTKLPNLLGHDLFTRGRRPMTSVAWELPGYEAHDLIGFGASGEVWRGRDTLSGDDVALKRLRVADAEGTARLRREAALLAALDHPHLLRLLDTVRSDDDGWVLVLDYAAGSSLAALLRERGRLRPGEVVTALAPLAAALAYAHGKGVVHGDVTPANVLFTADGRPLLADLGIARVVCDEDPVRATPEYADPAVAAGAAPGPATDVFAVAAVAFHALTGAPPWSGDSAEETLFAAAGGEVPELRTAAPEAPESLLRVLERALSVEPARRGSAGELALDLRHACTPEPVELGTGPTAIPAAARPAALTHEVRAARPPAPTRSRHRRPDTPGRVRRGLTAVRRCAASKGLRAAVLGIVSIGLAVRLGIAWAGSGTEQAAAGLEAPVGRAPVSPAPGSLAPHFTGTAARWASVLRALDATRQEAFAAGDPRRLDAVYLPGSAPLAADRAQINAIGSNGSRAVGVRHELSAVRVVQSGHDRAVIDVAESLAGYQLRHGDQVDRRPAQPAKRYRVTLHAQGHSWRIAGLTLRSGQ